jgi:hypothetical protein
MRVTRVGKMFNRKGEPGVFDVSRSKFYADFILRDPADPNVPGTNIARLRLVHLGPKAVGVADDEVERLITALQDHHASKAAERAKAKRPAHRASAESPRGSSGSDRRSLRG